MNNVMNLSKNIGKDLHLYEWLGIVARPQAIGTLCTHMLTL